MCSKAVDYGVFELSVDGRGVERHFDFFDEKVTSTGEIPLGTFDLAAGKHVLEARAIGRNPKAKIQNTGGHIFGLDYLRARGAIRE